MIPSSRGAAHSPIKFYLGIFTALTIVTAVEMLPLFGLLAIPGPILLLFSFLKFVTVCAFFMHLFGDHPIFTRLFFIPLVMMGLTVMVLMTLFKSWDLHYQGADSDAVAARYRGEWKGDCNAWVTSPFTGNAYCASPNVPLPVATVYAELKPSGEADPRFEGFAAKSPEEQQATLMAVGGEVYAQNCQACHQATGAGLAGVFPPLVNDPVVSGPAEGHISVLLKGMNGVEIAGVKYPGAMPPWVQLSDEDIAAVITYERNSWGNTAGAVTPAQIAAAR